MRWNLKFKATWLLFTVSLSRKRYLVTKSLLRARTVLRGCQRLDYPSVCTVSAITLPRAQCTLLCTRRQQARVTPLLRPAAPLLTGMATAQQNAKPSGNGHGLESSSRASISSKNRLGVVQVRYNGLIPRKSGSNRRPAIRMVHKRASNTYSSP